MRNKRFVKHTSRAFAILMSAMMAVGIAMPVNAAGKKDSKKEDKTETVYVNANADGSVDKITVSDWLKNHSSSDTLEDFSNLENIKCSGCVFYKSFISHLYHSLNLCSWNLLYSI